MNAFRILFDHQAFVMQKHGGVSRCFAELFKHLPNEVDAMISVKETENAYLRGRGVGKPRGYYVDHFILPYCFPMKGRMFAAYRYLLEGMPYRYDNDFNWAYKNYSKLSTIKLLQKGCFDVFHPTFYDDYFLPYLNGKPFVLTIHDMIPELYPQYFDKDNDMQILSKRKLAPLASAIIAVSEKTKNDVVSILDVPEEKVHVIYHGSEHIPEYQDDNNEIARPYILYVGERWGYKNFDLFVDAVAPLLKRHQELRVVCTGKAFNNEEFQQMKSLGVMDRFIHKWVTTDKEFSTLYHNAVCFVYTSEYEGFGIPILEAYKADCPVMLNRASCFPEIAGDAAVYFSLTKCGSDFSERFEELYSFTKEQKDELLRKQRERLKLYSWKQSAEQLAEVYRNII